MNTQSPGAEALTNQQLIERWQNVERVLVNLPKHERTKHWRMSTFGRTTACGTVACAAGHCGMDPWFQAQGMHLEPASDDWDEPRFSGQSPFRFLTRFFGEEGCEEIFYNGVNRSVEEVIAEVREHIAWLQKRESSAVSKE